MDKEEQLNLLRRFDMHLLNEGYCVCGCDSTHDDAPTPYYQASHDTIERLIRNFIGIRPQGVVSGQPLWSDLGLYTTYSQHPDEFDDIVALVQEQFPSASSSALCHVAANILRRYEMTRRK